MLRQAHTYLGRDGDNRAAVDEHRAEHIIRVQHSVGGLRVALLILNADVTHPVHDKRLEVSRNTYKHCTHSPLTRTAYTRTYTHTYNIHNKRHDTNPVLSTPCEALTKPTPRMVS